MAEMDQNYVSAIQQALDTKRDSLDKNEMGKLKEELRAFHSSFASLYNIYLKKKLIDEDPYKQETKISEIEVPDSSVFQEAKRIEQLSVRLSNFDNQLDFLVNFYQLGLDFLNLDRVKRIVGLVRYIDWVSFSPDSQSLMTKSVALLTNQSKAGVDAITLSIIGEGLSKLSKVTNSVMKTLKDLNTFYREKYKLSIRQQITQNMSANDATMENIRKKMPSALPGQPFYKELIDEIIKEDYSSSGPDLREAILNILKVVEEKPKAVKPAVNFKAVLLDGIQVIGGAGNILGEIMAKLDENHMVMESHKKGILEAIREILRQITHAEPKEVIYNIEYVDPTKGVPVKDKVLYHQFTDEMEKKIRNLNSFVRGSAYQKLSAMSEDQIIGYLERNIRDTQSFHRILGGLDDYFKANVAPEDRGKIKGVKPELSALKNSFVKANQIQHEYNALKEEDEQMKKLGINPTAILGDPTASIAPPPAAAPAPAAASS